MKCLQVLKDAKDGITSIQVTDHEILVGSLDCIARCYDIRTGQVVTDFIGGTFLFFKKKDTHFS